MAAGRNTKWNMKYENQPLKTITLKFLNPLKANPQNGQTHSNNSSATANKLFDSV